MPGLELAKPIQLPRYRFQRYYHALYTDHYLLKQAQRQDPVRVFFNQGCIDSACGLYVLSSTLVIFDLAKSVALVDMANRKYGVPAIVFDTFEHTYFTGVSPIEFVRLTDSLNLPMNFTLMESATEGCDRWIIDCLMAGELVAVVTASAKNTARDQHWALAVGVEGLHVGRENRPDTILLLDPSETEPSFSPSNARLKVALSGPGSANSRVVQHLYGSSNPSKRALQQRIVWDYESKSFSSAKVVLMAAVRFRVASQSLKSSINQRRNT